MKRLFYFLPFLLLNIASTCAQNLTVGTAGMPLREVKSPTGKDSPYFNSEFVQSKVTASNHKGITLEALRYNMLNQQVEYLNKDIVYEVQDSLSSFTVTDSTGKSHLFEKMSVNGASGFFEVLLSGKLGLLKHYSAAQRSAEDWYTKKKVLSVVRTTDYYVLKDGKTERFTPSKKTVLEIMSDKAKDVKSYLNNNAPDFKNDESLKELFEYYNSLSEKA